MRIHLGANTRPISFEYYTKNLNTEQTTSATYYYHYDLHGNVIRVTDSSGTTQITYTYDPLGTITSTTNTNSIYNPFTYMGEAQIIQDSEFDTSASSPKTGLYASGSSYYNPETGTSLGGSGAPAMTNPSSSSMEEPSAQETKPAEQLSLHAAIAAVAGGIPSSGTCSSDDVTPETPYDPLVPMQITEPPTISANYDSCLATTDTPAFDPWDFGNTNTPKSLTDWFTRTLNKAELPPGAGKSNDQKNGMGNDVFPGGRPDLGNGHYKNDGTDVDPQPVQGNVGDIKRSAEGTNLNPVDGYIVWDELYNSYARNMIGRGLQPVPRDIYWELFDKGVSVSQMENEMDWVLWGYDTTTGKYSLFGYKLCDIYENGKLKENRLPHFFWGPHASTDARHVKDEVSIGDELKPGKKVLACGEKSCNYDYPLIWSFRQSWNDCNLGGANYTGQPIHIEIVMNLDQHGGKGILFLDLSESGSASMNYGKIWNSLYPKDLNSSDSFGTVIIVVGKNKPKKYILPHH